MLLGKNPVVENRNKMAGEIEVSSYKFKVKPTKAYPNSILYVKGDTDTTVSTYITDINGIPYPLKDEGTGISGIQTITNSDGTISVLGTDNTILNLSTSIKAIINSALQPGSNISELVNDSQYLVNTDLPDTKLKYNTTLTDGDFLFVGDVSDTPDATTSAKGKVKLAGDLGGTADLPTVPGLALKANLDETIQSVTGTMLDNSDPLNPIILSDNNKEDLSNKAINFSVLNNDLYPTTEAVEDRINEKIPSDFYLPLPSNYVRVLVITGQSNGAGRGANSEATAEELAVSPNVKIWSKINSQFEYLDVGTNNLSTGLLHGIELGIAVEAANLVPTETVYIIKHAVGGSNIAFNSPGGVVYEELVNNFLNPAINNLLSIGKIPYVHFYYSQGEADSGSPANYGFDFAKLRATWRKNISSAIHFIVPEIIEFYGGGYITINNFFRGAETSDVNMNLIQSKDYQTYDNVHFTYTALKLIAKEVFDLMLKTRGGVVRETLPYVFDSNGDEVISRNVAYTGNVDFSKSNFILGSYQIVFINSTIANSTNSKLNSRLQPFKTMADAIAALPPWDGSVWRLHFLNEAVHVGSQIPVRSFDFYSDYFITIDFTTVNQGGKVVNGFSSISPYASLYNVINFPTGNIICKSDYTGIQSFSSAGSHEKITGKVGFNWKASGGNTANDYIVQCRVPTDLIITEWSNYSTHGAYNLGFQDGSNIIIKKITNVDNTSKYTFRGNNFSTLNNANIIIELLIMTSGSFLSMNIITIKSITGTGVIKSLKTIFDNCTAASGITFDIANPSFLSGKLISTNAWLTTSLSNLLEIKDFTGKIGIISLATVNGKITLSGNCELAVSSNIINNGGTNAEVMTVLNGVTVLNQTTPANSLVTGTASNLGIYGILKTNNTNLGVVTKINYTTNL